MGSTRVRESDAASRVRAVRASRVTLLFAAVLAGVACADETRESGVESQMASASSVSRFGGTRKVLAIEARSLTDSAEATYLRDSLNTAGWTTSVVSSSSNGRRVHVVRVSLTTSSDNMPLLVSAALKRAGLAGTIVADASAPAAPEVNDIPLHTTIEAPVVRLLWLQSASKRGMIVVRDAAGAGGEAVPNAFVLVSEAGMFTTQSDSVWDVEPSPNWRWVAFSRAHVLPADGGTVSDAQWSALSTATTANADSLRQSAFPLNAMRSAYGVALTYLVNLPWPNTELGPPRLLGPLGWRLQWTATRNRLMIGGNPTVAREGEMSSTAFFINAANGRRVPATAMAPVMREERWGLAMRLDPGRPLDLEIPRVFATEAGNVESRDGWVRLRGKIIGPGALIAPTRMARYIAVLLRDPDLSTSARIVVYEIAAPTQERP